MSVNLFARMFISVCLFFFVFTKPVFAEEQIWKVGVLAKRGVEQATQKWQLTTQFLSDKLPGHKFQLVPLAFDDVNTKVAAGEIDFLITNPSMYVEVETLYGASRLATLRNLGPDGKSLTMFGGVILTKADRQDIETIADLKHISSFMAVKKSSLGGFQLAWMELKKHGIDPFSDFDELSFRSKHDSVVYAVQKKLVDAGTVRTDTLERMAAEGKINIDDFKVISARQPVQDFPYKVSTALMPEWPFAKLSHTPDQLSQKVAVALLEMDRNNPAAISGKYEGWTVALNYQPVRYLMQELQIGPFRDFGKMSIHKLIEQYWMWIISLFIAFIMLVIVMTYIIKINRKLTSSERTLLVEVSERHKVEASLEQHGEALRAEIQRNKESLEHLEKIRKFHELTSLLITTLNPKELLQKALDRIVDLSESDIGGIYLYNEETASLKAFVFHGMGDAALEYTRLRETIVGQVIADKKHLHITEIPDDCHIQIDFGLIKTCPRELLFLPLQSKGKALGAIVLGALKSYDKTDIEVLLHMADQISIMLDNALTNDEMERLSTRDELTNLYNRRYLNDVLATEVQKSLRTNQNIGLLIIDVDNFKVINDTKGHPEGDKVLKLLAESITDNTRSVDVVGRYGGEEFMIIMPSTDLEGAMSLAEKLREAVELIDFSSFGQQTITISIGAAALVENKVQSLERFIKVADNALYQAKLQGRNQSCSASL